MIQASRAPRASLVLALGASLALAACSSGAEVDVFGGGGSPPVQPLEVDFALRTDLYLGATQTSDALAVDLDGDGRADIVEANFLDGTIRSALRDSLGGYGLTEVVPGSGGAVWRLGSGDIDGDGLVDVVAVEVVGPAGTDPAVTVFLQDAPGSFGAVVSADLAGNPIDLDVIPSELSPLFGGVPGGDLIAVAENYSHRVSLWRWDGAGLELAATLNSSALGLGSPLTIAGLDIGGEGLMDIVVGEAEIGDQPDRVIAYPADGAGGFGAPLLLALADVPILEEVGDLDGNGFADIGVAQLESTSAQALLFDAGGLSEVLPIEFPGGTSSIVFGDLDGQGGPVDVAATVLLTQELVVRLGAPPGPATLAFGPPTVLNAGFLPRTVAAVELNDDANLDLLCPSNGDISMLFGDGAGDFRAAHGYSVGSQPVNVQVADLDGDLDLDLVTVDAFQRQVSFLDNVDGLGHYVLAAEIPFEVPASEELPGGIDIGDVDEDGDNDIVIALHAMNEVRVVHNPGTTVAGFNTTTYEIYGLGSMLYGVALADLNNDDVIDIVVSSSGDQTARVLLNDPAAPGQYVQQPPIALTFKPAAVICDDLDGDGNADAAFTGKIGEPVDGVGASGPVMGVLAGDGQGGFTVQNTLPIDTFGSSLASGDFNSDGMGDLVAGQPALAFEQVWVYNSVGAFEYEGAPLSVDGSPGSVSVADVNRDGDLDIVIPTGEGELRVALGDGTGAFPVIEPPGLGTWPVPLGTLFSAFEDVDGDELQDLVLVSPKTPNVWIGRNVSVELPEM